MWLHGPEFVEKSPLFAQQSAVFSAWPLILALDRDSQLLLRASNIIDIEWE